MLSLVPLAPGMDQDTMMSVINDNFNQVEGENRTKVIVDEKGSNRVIIGRYPNGEYGVKISEEGKDVLKVGADELIFDSSNNLFRIVKKGEITLSLATLSNGATQSTSDFVEHGLGYSPLVIAFSTIPNPQQPRTDTHMFGGSRANYKSVSTSAVTIGYLEEETVSASEAYVFFDWRRTNATGIAQPPLTATIKYYLLTETAD